MAKSADAFRTISEVADWLETPAHVLRFWESKFPQVKPVKRAGGRRYYRPSDMELLGGIKKLLHTDGLTIKGVQKILREQGVRHVAEFSQPLDHGDEIALETAPVVEIETPEPDLGRVLSFPTSDTADVAPSPAPESDTPAMRPTPDGETQNETREELPDVAEASPTDRPAPESETEIAPQEPEAADAPAQDDRVAGADTLPRFAHHGTEASAPSPATTLEQSVAPPPKRARHIETPPDAEDATPAPIGLLTRLAQSRGPIDPEKAVELSALLSRLTGLRNRMSEHHKE